MNSSYMKQFNIWSHQNICFTHPRDPPGPPSQPDPQDSQDPLGPPDPPNHSDSQDPPNPLDPQDPADLRDPPDPLGPQDPSEHPENILRTLLKSPENILDRNI